MENERSAQTPVLAAIGLLLAALFLRSSWLGLLVALAALVPAAYVTWLGVQATTQKRMAVGVVLLLAALVVAALILLGKLLGWLF